MNRLLKHARLRGYPALEHPAFAHPHLPYYQCGEAIWQQVHQQLPPDALHPARRGIRCHWTPYPFRLQMYASEGVLTPREKTVFTVRSLGGRPEEVYFLLQTLLERPPLLRLQRTRTLPPPPPAPPRVSRPPVPPPQADEGDNLARPVHKEWLKRYHALGGRENPRTVAQFLQATRALVGSDAIDIHRLLTGAITPARWANEQLVYLHVKRAGFPATARVQRGQEAWIQAILNAPAGGLETLYNEVNKR